MLENWLEHWTVDCLVVLLADRLVGSKATMLVDSWVEHSVDLLADSLADHSAALSVGSKAMMLVALLADQWVVWVD